MNLLKNHVKTILYIILGTFLIAIATNGVLRPNKLLSGGITGLSMLLNFLLDWNMSLLIILFNIPLFILAFVFLPKQFIRSSLFGMFMLSFWLEVTRSVVISANSELSVILIGGVIYGFGVGIIFRGDGSTGGTDIIAKVINQYFSLNMATVNLVLNGIIIISSILFFGIDLSILTLATMYVSTQVTNYVVDGINHKRTLFIITSKKSHQLIADALLEELHRGVTLIPAEGAYTHDSKYILYTTIGVRQVAKAKSIILKYDKTAFMTVSETSQVIGNGRGFLHFPNAS